MNNEARLDSGSAADRRRSILTRRNVLVTSAWAAPTIVVATAVPATAHSGAHTWTITSASYEGDNTSPFADNGTRANTGQYRMKFSINVPAGSVVHSPQVVLQAHPDDSVENGNGVGPLCALGSNTPVVTTASPSGTVDGWAVTGSGPTGTITGADTTDAFRKFVFTRTAITGPVTVTLNFNLLGIAAADIGPSDGNTVTFSSAQSTTQTFTMLEANAPAATDPAGLILTGPVIT